MGSLAKLVPPDERYHVPEALAGSTRTVQFLRKGGRACVIDMICVL